MKYEQIKKQAEEAIKELLEKTHLKKDDIFVVGCSSSEIKGESIGRGSDINAAEAVYEAICPVLKERGIYLAAQCCEHLNRAIIVEREALRGNEEIVNVVPQLHAGGSFWNASESCCRSCAHICEADWRGTPRMCSHKT